MDDENHELAMERGLRRMKQRKPLQRSATYAFGQPCVPGAGQPEPADQRRWPLLVRGHRHLHADAC